VSKENVTKFTVYRERWFRGKGWSQSQLLRGDGTMCCLGFYAKSCGATDDHILGKAAPSMSQGFWPDWMYRFPARVPVVNEMMAINDGRSLPDEERERQLTELFAAQGITVEFKDGAGP
jgi:hypothetical protein